MEELIERFLLLYKYCPLLEIGTLELKELSAVSVNGGKFLSPPTQTISLDADKITDDSAFIRFVSGCKGLSYDEAKNFFHTYISTIRNLEMSKELILNRTCFFSNIEGELSYSQIDFPREFLPVVQLKKIFHPESGVGQGKLAGKNRFILDFFNKVRIRQSELVMVCSVALAISAILMIGFYFFHAKNVNLVGNGSHIKIKAETRQYDVIQ